MEPNHICKVVIMGNSGVGKSNLMIKYVMNEFDERSTATIGVEFMSKSETIEGRNVKLHIWDTAGQERFRAVSRSVYQGAHAIILVYDITDRKSFNDVYTWLQEIASHSGQNHVLIVLVGNKLDLEEDRIVARFEGERLAMEKKTAFFETSAFSGINVEQVFRAVAEFAFNRSPHDEQPFMHPIRNVLHDTAKPKKNCCT